MFRKLLYTAFGLKGSAEARRFEAATANARSVQVEKLMELVARNADTAFGREHGFASIKTVSDFQESVPIREYEGFGGYINRIAAGEKAVLTTDDPFMFATTSGTTGARKLIPITRS